jgi:hypothetical protein
MPSWVEQLAWIVPCPACGAPVDEACISWCGDMERLEFNHPTRNQTFHDRRQQQRQAPLGSCVSP